MAEKKLLFSTTHDKLYIEEEEDNIALRHKYYPIPSYGNRVETVIRLHLDNNRVTVYAVRYGWNGTGCDPVADVQLTQEEATRLKELLQNARTLEDFEKIRELVEEIQSKREEEWLKVIDEIVTALEETLPSPKQVDIEELKSMVEEYVMEYLKDLDT